MSCICSSERARVKCGMRLKIRVAHTVFHIMMGASCHWVGAGQTVAILHSKE